MPDTTFTTPVVETHLPTFLELGVPEPLCRVLAADGKTEAFPIQADTLPDSLNGRDVLGRGRTGSGKTLAFALPMAARLMEAAWEPGMRMGQYRYNVKHIRRRHLEERQSGDFHPHPRGLVLAPTRELANQINDVLQPLAQMAGMTTTTVYGGVKQNRQVRDLMSGADIVVACPGRLEDLLNQKLLTLSDVRVVVLDEADEMADMGFLPPVRRILAQVRPDAQHMLFSATLDHGVDELVREFLRDPKTHSVDEPTAASDMMTQHVFAVEKDDRMDVVLALAAGKGRRILFTRTKYQAKNLAKKLTQHGIPAAQLHGNLNQNQRDRNLAAFEDGDVNVLVATDVAARGIDVSNVELVIQVDPPADPKSFVHRSGRTARAGRRGDVVTLVLPFQRREAQRMLKAAGIDEKPVKVRHDSPQVLELAGEKAEPVFGWNLDATQPAGNPRSRKGGKGRPASGRDGEPRDGKSRDERREDRPKLKRNRAERRAGMQGDREAEERERRFETGATPHAKRSAKQSDKRADRRTGKRSAANATNAANRSAGGKRIHHHDENRIIQDERSEKVKRHERRMAAKRGGAQGGPHRRHTGKRTRAPFRSR
ncbi:DEAD/DEAH box helicase [Bifidobacterium sp. CP2]|uniref:DEAD/DEAH box helicase n=1 Tax=Bifidobacterium sp. CP2 TaxID=2809025 RepID=UPI003204EF39